MSLWVVLTNVSGSPVEETTSFLNQVIPWIIGGAIGLAVCASAFWLVRRFIFSGRHIPLAFQRCVLLVMMPKDQQQLDERSERAPSGLKEAMAVAEALFANLAGIIRAQSWWSQLLYGRQDHVGLEIVANQDVISFYLAVPRKYKEYVEQQVQAQYPDAQIDEVDDYNIFAPQSAIAGAYVVLKKRGIFPIRSYLKMESDPMNALTNVLSKFRQPDGAAIQLLVRPARHGWQSAGQKFVRSVILGKSGSSTGSTMGEVWKAAFPSQERQMKQQEYERTYRMSPLEEEQVKAVGEKVSKVGFEANIRVVVSAGDEARARINIENIINSFTQYTYPEVGNGFRRIQPGRRKHHELVTDFIYRRFHDHHKLILNTEELTSVFHFPLPSTETPNIRWLTAKRSAPPVVLPTEGITLGQSLYRGQELLVKMKRDDRRRHVYVIGKSGVGKSNLIINLAVQDIRAGEGVCVIDPHGDLIEDILQHVPPERADDVIIFDPSDMDRPMGLNMLEADTPEERDFAVQEMIAIFYKLFPPEMIGPMFEHNMRNVMLTLMEDEAYPGTIADIPRMFTDTDFQKYKVSKVTDPVVRAFWEKEMAKTSDFHKSEMLGYLISKVGRFVENRMMRNIIGQSRSGFDFKKVMNERKILLVNLAKGKTGEVNSALLGLIIVSKLQMAALSRASLPPEQRHDFYLYIDEFQNFITDSVATILSEARKYRLNLIIAHQYMGQLLQGQDTKIRDAVLGNAGTIIAFKVGVEDAEIVARMFAPVFNQYDVLNIEKYNAYVKLLVDNQPVRAFNMRPLPPEQGNSQLAQRIKDISRLRFGRDRAAVENDIMARTKLGEAPASPLDDLPMEPKA